MKSDCLDLFKITFKSMFSAKYFIRKLEKLIKALLDCNITIIQILKKYKEEEEC